jgi:ATP-binding cassette subfamily B protein
MKPEVTTSTALLYIFKMLKPFRLGLFIMLWVACLWAIDLSLRPYILKNILNRLSENSAEGIFNYLAYPVILYLGMIFIISSSFRLYDYFVTIKMIPNLRRNIANNALDLLINKSHSYYQNNFSGSLTNKINDLTNNVPELIQIIIDRFLAHGLSLIIAIYFLWQVNIKFALAMSFCTFFFILLSLFLSKKLTALSDHWSESNSNLTGKLVDLFSNMLSVRLFNSKPYEKKHIDSSFQEVAQAEQKLQWSFFLIWFVYGYSFFILQILNLYWLIKGRQEGLISVGDFVLVLSINIAIINSLWEVAKDFSQFSKLLGKVIQALKVIIIQPEINDIENPTNLVVTEGKIIFDKVKFHYKDSHPLFENKSIVIEKKQKIGLVGYSGSGKTTFANLILRLYDVTDGKIFIDEQDISQVTQDSLHQAISMIPQEPGLFHRSILENIRYGKIDASDEEVIEAAKLAHADQFIAKMPEGYYSLIGERGVKISGGQRQRLAIARAILKNAPILILDEATSQLDSLTEQDIQESLWKLMQGRTTLIIAHRLSTLLNMDRILVFDKGKIIEEGSHQELFHKNGLYTKLWNTQIGGFLIDS